MTRTRKVRRRFVAEKYAAGDRGASTAAPSEVELTTEITYEDGRKAMLHSTIAIGDVDEPARMPARRRPHRTRDRAPDQARSVADPALAKRSGDAGVIDA